MTDTAPTDTAEEIMIVTDAARATVLDIRSNEDDAELLGLRVEVTGANGADYTYDLSLEPVAEAADDDFVHTNDGLSVIIPANSVDAMRGATLDLPSVAGQGGLVIRNPNRPNPLGDLGQLELVGDAADKVHLADRAHQPRAGLPRWLCRTRRGRGRGVRHDGWWLPGMLDERSDPAGGHSASDSRGGAGDHRSGRHHRSRPG